MTSQAACIILLYPMAVVVLSKHTHPKAPPNRWATTRPQQCILLLLGVFVFAYFKSSVSVDSNTGSTNINSTNFLSSTKVSSSSSTAKEVQEGDSSTTNNINSAMSMSNINSAIEPGTQVPRHDEASGYSYWLYTRQQNTIKPQTTRTSTPTSRSGHF